MKNKFTIAILVIFFFSTSLFIVISQKQQELRTRAATTAKLYFSPQSTLINPIEKRVGENFSVDVMLDPGDNSISLLRLKMAFNDTAFEAMGRDTFVTNTAAFPTIMEGPIIDTDNGYISITFSIGADRLKAIQKPTKLGTINLKAKQAVNIITSTIVFDNRTQAFSVRPNDHAFENVIGTAIPAYISIVDGHPTPEPTSFENPTSGPTPETTPGTPTIVTTTTPTYAPTIKQPTPTPHPNDTILSFETLLHGLGSAGDNVNPRDNTLSNKDPQNTKRNVTIDILTTTNEPVLTKNGLATYEPTTGSFRGTVNLGNTFSSGNYIIKIKGEGYLRQQIQGVHYIKAATLTKLPKSSLTTGDINNDNSLNILDFNILTSCFSEITANPTCAATKRKPADLTDDDKVNHFDYNLFLREISSQNGK